MKNYPFSIGANFLIELAPIHIDTYSLRVGLGDTASLEVGNIQKIYPSDKGIRVEYIRETGGQVYHNHCTILPRMAKWVEWNARKELIELLGEDWYAQICSPSVTENNLILTVTRTVRSQEEREFEWLQFTEEGRGPVSWVYNGTIGHLVWDLVT